MDKRGLLIVISGPSGVGKDTVIERLLEHNEKMTKSISATTRARRATEQHGKDYYFMDRREFENLATQGKMLEYAEYCGYYYGTPKSYVEECLKRGIDVILKIEVEGEKQVKSICKDAVSIFILPPSISVLEQRLKKRGTESTENAGARLYKAKKEIKSALRYDYIVTNGKVKKCVEDINAIVKSEKMKTKNMKNIVKGVLV